MEHLEFDKLIDTLEKLEKVLEDAGLAKDSVQIGFNFESLDEKLLSLKSDSTENEIPIKTKNFECHFGGCGMICCTF